MMNWSLDYTKDFQKDFSKLDKRIQIMITVWIEKHLLQTSNPRVYGKALVGPLKGLWRYRIGDYRLIAKIKDNKITIVLLNVGHRSDVYDNLSK